MTEQIPEQRERYDQHHGRDRAATDLGHLTASCCASLYHRALTGRRAMKASRSLAALAPSALAIGISSKRVPTGSLEQL
ncbi:MAG TPA: hypothetical protein VEN78_12675, partial [Bradyrhizobium sp.]|nr:hypothetical protein [Bradyrhizobium sp.]